MPRRYRKSNPTQHLIILSSLIGLAIVGAQFAAPIFGRGRFTITRSFSS